MKRKKKLTFKEKKKIYGTSVKYLHAKEEAKKKGKTKKANKELKK